MKLTNAQLQQIVDEVVDCNDSDQLLMSSYGAWGLAALAVPMARELIKLRRRCRDQTKQLHALNQEIGRMGAKLNPSRLRGTRPADDSKSGEWLEDLSGERGTR